MPRLSSLQKYILSGLFYAWLFPNVSFGFLAWVSLVPLIHASQRVNSRQKAFCGGLVSGLIGFGLSMTWVAHVVWFGWIFAAAVEAVFFGFFSLLVYESRRIRNPGIQILWVAASWTVTEVFRSEIPILALPWNLLGYSQTGMLTILQIANVVGAFGLGFIIAIVNACFARCFSLFQFIRLNHQQDRRTLAVYENSELHNSQSLFQEFFRILFFILIIFSALFFYGLDSLSHPKISGTVRIAVIQGNIPQDLKWSSEAKTKILDIYLKMTELAAAEQPDLIVWPEAAYPGYFNREPFAAEIVMAVQKLKVPLLLGSPFLESMEVAYNSAYLLDENGSTIQRYDKQRLVPFGEYLPLPASLSQLRAYAYALGVSDFSSGHEATVFQLPRVGHAFSTLICFEDTFADLAREFVQKGARFLLVITNDAWFGLSQAPYQHLQASILRAVENGVPVIRAANTGVSSFIDSQGRETFRVRDANKKDLFSFGWKTETVKISNQITFYQKAGYLFSWLIVFAWVLIGASLFRSNFKFKNEDTK